MVSFFFIQKEFGVGAALKY